jgi:ferredoxin-NADP reductase
MVATLDIIGYAILAAALGQAGTGFAGMLWRQLHQRRLERQDRELFRRRAEHLLRAAEADRQKRELSWTGLRKFTVERKVFEAEGIASFYLRPHDGQPIPPFEPGQYLTFQFRIPGQTKHVVRCYSLSDGPTRRDHYRITVKELPPPRDKPEAPPGLASAHLHRGIAEGDTLDVRAPNGHFYLDRSSSAPVVLIGGGIGLTPMLSMLTTICDSDDRRETWLFYGVRHGGEHILPETLAGFQRAHPNVRVVVCYSEPRPEDRAGRDYDHENRVSVDLLRRHLPGPNYQFYLCGPPPMMQALYQDLRDWGAPESAINYEAFGPATVKTTHQATSTESATSGASEDAVEVEFARSGRTVSWRPDDGALLDVAEAHDIAIDCGCRAGNCGTCLTAIKDGEVGYLSEPGVPPEEGSCLTCIAVPKGRLVLDA